MKTFNRSMRIYNTDTRAPRVCTYRSLARGVIERHSESATREDRFDLLGGPQCFDCCDVDVH